MAVEVRGLLEVEMSVLVNSTIKLVACEPAIEIVGASKIVKVSKVVAVVRVIAGVVAEVVVVVEDVFIVDSKMASVNSFGVDFEEERVFEAEEAACGGVGTFGGGVLPLFEGERTRVSLEGDERVVQEGEGSLTDDKRGKGVAEDVREGLSIRFALCDFFGAGA